MKSCLQEYKRIEEIEDEHGDAYGFWDSRNVDFAAILPGNFENL
ncbi:MAG: hypothetical protein R3B93_20500 [Bacteroidia bacterium]